MPQDRGGSSADLDRLNDYLETQHRARTDDWASILRRTVERLDAAFAHFDWTGVYLVEGDDLILGPYVGPPTDLVRIPIGQGICGAAVAERATIVVDDVNADPRYLACFTGTKSEIVVLIADGDRVIGEIDVDSDQPAAFGAADRTTLEGVAGRLARLAPPDAGLNT